MKNLKVTYKSKTIEAQLPETWNEMTMEQFMTAVEIWNGGVDKDRFLCRMFSLPKNIVLLMDDFLKFTLLEQTEWMRRLESHAAGSLWRPCQARIIRRQECACRV